jgi:hypothetical protein
MAPSPGYDILKLYTAAAAPVATGVVHDLGDVKEEWELVVINAGATFSLQLNGSEDGTNFVAMGSAVTTAGSSVPAGLFRYIRADLTAVTGGTVTAELAFGGGM